MKSKLQKLFKQYNEYVITLLGLVLFFAVVPLIQNADPTSGTLDGGYLHALVYMLCCSGWIFGVAWLEMKMTYPILHGYLDDELEESITQYQGKYNETNIKKAALTLLCWAFYVSINTIILINII